MTFRSNEILHTRSLAPDVTRTFHDQFLEKNFEYDDKSMHCKRLNNSELPDTTPEVVARLNVGYGWEAWGGVRLSPCRCFYVRPTGQGLLFSTVRRVLGEAQPPTRLLASVLSVPNGQVKNFLNATRAANEIKDNQSIAVIGSKAAEGGGLWHQYFLLYLLRRVTGIIVDFYDFSEIAESKNYEMNGRTVNAEWRAEGFDHTLQEDYDLIIDDTWSYSQGPGLNLQYAGQYSWKGTSEIKDGYIPFLHSTETRKFSTKPRQEVQTGCMCPTCRVVKDSVRTYEDYLFLRLLVSRVGYTLPCQGLPDQTDLAAVGTMLREVSTQPRVRIKRDRDVRSVIALSEEIPLTLDGRGIRKEGEQSFKPISRRQTHEYQEDRPVYPWLRGKRVLFCGVSVSIIGDTKIAGGQGVQSFQEADYAFVASREVWNHQLAMCRVYAPLSPQTVRNEFPDWIPSGQKIGQFWEYYRDHPPEKRMEEQQPCQRGKYSIGPPHDVFPYLDISLHGSWLGKRAQKPIGNVTPYTLHTQAPYIVLSKYDPTHWKRSIWIDSRSNWGFAKEIIEHLPSSDTYLQASVPLPWDMSILEVQDVERRLDISNQEWRSAPIRFTAKNGKYDNRPVLGFLSRQKEFLRLTSLKSRDIVIVRSEDAHPISFMYDESVMHEWENAQYLGYVKGLQHIQRYISKTVQMFEPG